MLSDVDNEIKILETRLKGKHTRDNGDGLITMKTVTHKRLQLTSHTFLSSEGLFRELSDVELTKTKILSSKLLSQKLEPVPATTKQLFAILPLT